MAFKISKEIIDKTKCESGFICLTGQGCPRCKVEFTAGTSCIMVEPKDDCHYAKSFGVASFICICPTRNEIYRKYGK